MAYPIRPVTRPADLISAANGNLDPALLVDVAFPSRGVGQLHRQTYRAWVAFIAAVKAATGVTLTITSLADAYRTFARQKSAFLTRMEPVSLATYLITRPSKRRKWSYGGNTYWRLKPGYAAVAQPGTSNHGWGLALDVCALDAQDNIIGLASSPAWAWVLANAERYGFSWESQDESWHLRLFTGDSPTAAVLAAEVGGGGGAFPPFNPARGQFSLWPYAENKRTLTIGAEGDNVAYLQGVILFHAGGRITVDRKYGPATAARVADLQRIFGKAGDGICGPVTWDAADYLATH